MAIGSPPITWDLKHTGEMWVYIGAPLPNPSGNTGVMVMVEPIKREIPLRIIYIYWETNEQILT